MIPRSSSILKLFDTPKANSMLWLTGLLTGLALSLPLNANLIAARFFDRRFNDPSLSYAFTSFYAAVFLGTKFIGVLTGMSQTSNNNKMSNKASKSVGGLAAKLLAIVLCMVLLIVQPWVNGYMLFMLIMIVTVAQAMYTSSLEVAALSTLTVADPTATQAVFLGHGAAGIWSAGVSLLFRVALPAYLANQAAVFNYAVSLLVVGLCAYLWRIFDSADIVEELPTVQVQVERDQSTSTLAIAKKLKVEIVAILLASAQALTMFPFLINKTAPVEHTPDVFYPLAFFASNAADMFGRMIPGWFRHRKGQGKWVLLLQIFRLTAFFVLLVGNLRIQSRALPFQLYASDTVFFVTLIISGVINGVVYTMTSMLVPIRLQDPDEQNRGAAIVSMTQMGGAFAGSLNALTLAYALASLAQ